jgi:hypothetical protein
LDLKLPPSPEHRMYARWASWGTRIGLAALVCSFLAYVLALLEPLVPLERLPALWSLPVERYVALTGAPTGWGWLARLGHADYLNVLGIALLASVTMLCYLRLLVSFLRRRDRLQSALAALQILVLLAAASGLLDRAH